MKRWLAFLQSDAGSAVPLLAAAVLALVLANSPLGGRRSRIPAPRDRPTNSLVHWINDGLMVVFFLLVGMEIKREVVAGELSRPVAGRAADRRRAGRHPAAGGDLRGAQLARPRARCTAGRSRRRPTSPSPPPSSACSGPRVPPSLRLFLLTLAIVDDLAADRASSPCSTPPSCRRWRCCWRGLCILVLVALNRARRARACCPICWSASCSGCAC